MSTAFGRPQGEWNAAHVDACGQGGEGCQKPDFFGRHKWMAPYILRFPPVPVQFSPYSSSSPYFSDVLTLNFLPLPKCCISFPLN